MPGVRCRGRRLKKSHAKAETRSLYLREWAKEQAQGARAGLFAWCWSLSRSTHWRWAEGKLKGAGARKMRIGEEVRRKVVELDRRYRSTWDARAIARVVGISAATVAKILRELRGPRPKRAKRPHTRRTRFIKRGVMWSSDFVRVGWGWLLIVTIDEMSGYRLGWDLCRSETAEAALAHARSIARRMERVPLSWKFDHGSAFTSKTFQRFLSERMIVPYPTPPRAPWANGRVERNHQDVHAWLIPLVGKDLSKAEIEREIDEGMLMFNYVKPRAAHRFRKSAEVCFSEDAGGLDNADDEIRGMFRQAIDDAKVEFGCMDVLDPNQLRKKSGEQMNRRAVRKVMQDWRLYEEWDTAVPKGPPEAEVVNRSGISNVAF